MVSHTDVLLTYVKDKLQSFNFSLYVFCSLDALLDFVLILQVSLVRESTMQTITEV